MILADEGRGLVAGVDGEDEERVERARVQEVQSEAETLQKHSSR
jgi:hypothetical protein